MNPTVKTILVWVLILVSAVTLWNIVEKQKQSATFMNLTDFLEAVEGRRVADVTVTGSSVRGRLRADNQVFFSAIPPAYTAVYESLIASGTKVTVIPTERRALMTAFVSWLLPMIVAFGFGWQCAVWSQGRRLQPPMTTA